MGGGGGGGILMILGGKFHILPNSRCCQVLEENMDNQACRVEAKYNATFCDKVL